MYKFLTFLVLYAVLAILCLISNRNELIGDLLVIAPTTAALLAIFFYHFNFLGFRKKQEALDKEKQIKEKNNEQVVSSTAKKTMRKNP